MTLMLIILFPQNRFFLDIDGECDLSYPSVYTRVSAHADWIAETVCERTGELCDNVKPPETSRSKASKRSKSGKGKKTKREKKGKSEE